MNKKVFDTLKKVYSNVTTTLITITDSDYTVIWTNTDFIPIFKTGSNLKKYIPINDDQIIDKNIILPATFENYNCSLNILPVFDNNKIDGYVIRQMSLHEIIIHHLNKDMSIAALNSAAQLRTQISGIISSAMLLHQSLETQEMYDEIHLLNDQVFCCYKVLAESANKVEKAKYSFSIFNNAKVDIGTFSYEIIMLIKSLLRSNNINLTYNYEKDVFVNIDTDRYLMVLLNIIVNSIQYNISETKDINIDIKRTGNLASITITDNGVGMDNDLIKQSLHLLNSTTHDKMSIVSKGGLGFFIVNLFCKVYNGTLYITSKQDYGTSVSITIPIHDGEDNAEEYLESKTANYLTNRFSSVYVLLSKVSKINFF